jgi:hypothetical protein
MDSYMIQVVEHHISPRAEQMGEIMALSEPTGETGMSRETEQGHFRSRANGVGGGKTTIT